MTTNRLIAILFGIIFVGGVVGSFFFGRASVKDTTIVSTKIERDTIIVRDTIVQYYPQEVARVVVRTERVEVPIVCYDTIREVAEVDLPITERVYEDENYRAVVEGYNPILKEFTVYPKTQIVTATETITNRKRWGVSLGVQGGYGITPHGMQPYAGVGISFGITF